MKTIRLIISILLLTVTTVTCAEQNLLPAIFLRNNIAFFENNVLQPQLTSAIASQGINRFKYSSPQSQRFNSSQFNRITRDVQKKSRAQIVALNTPGHLNTSDYKRTLQQVLGAEQQALNSAINRSFSDFNNSYNILAYSIIIDQSHRQRVKNSANTSQSNSSIKTAQRNIVLMIQFILSNSDLDRRHETPDEEEINYFKAIQDNEDIEDIVDIVGIDNIEKKLNDYYDELEIRFSDGDAFYDTWTVDESYSTSAFNDANFIMNVTESTINSITTLANAIHPTAQAEEQEVRRQFTALSKEVAATITNNLFDTLDLQARRIQAVQALYAIDLFNNTSLNM